MIDVTFGSHDHFKGRDGFATCGAITRSAKHPKEKSTGKMKYLFSVSNYMQKQIYTWDNLFCIESNWLWCRGWNRLLLADNRNIRTWDNLRAKNNPKPIFNFYRNNSSNLIHSFDQLLLKDIGRRWVWRIRSKGKAFDDWIAYQCDAAGCCCCWSSSFWSCWRWQKKKKKNPPDDDE